MSKGRKKRSSTFKVSGTSRADILGNLTQAGGGRKELKRETKSFTTSASRDMATQTQDRADFKKKADDYKRESLVDLSQETIDELNIRFQQRAGEVLSRNTFKGREQLVLTNR